jgi:tetratricopeptide (TPR) repeat protein
VSILSRRIPYDRKRMFERADALGGTWRWRRALTLYRQILAAEPLNAKIHARVAPLLARSGRSVEAWESFQIAVEALREAGDAGSARTLERQATRVLPKNFHACRALARTELARGSAGDALRILVEGSRRLTRARQRGGAIVLLREAREIDAWNPPIVLDLCRLLSRDGEPGEALFLLDHLEERVVGEELRTVRARIWWIEPSLRHSWRWMRAAREVRAAHALEVSRPSPSRT